MSSKIKKYTVGFYFHVQLLLGMSSIEREGKDLAGAIFAKWMLKLTFIFGLNALLPEGFGLRLSLS